MVGQPIQLLIVDKHAMVRKGMKAFLDGYEGICVAAEVADGSEAVQLVEELHPDVVLIDLMLPGMDGIETIKRMVASRPGQPIIVLTAYDKGDRIVQAVRAGAMGCLVKNADPGELIQAIRSVHAGIPALSSTLVWRILGRRPGEETFEEANYLSEREIEVLRLLAKGNSDQEIAQELCLTTVTVRTHIYHILIKLNTKSRVQAVLYGLRSGLVTLEQTKDPANALF